MILFEELKNNRDKYRLDFLLAKPFPHLVLDNICDEEKINRLYNEIPEISTKSRDYVFAANKFEKSKIKEISPLFEELHNDLISKDFEDFLKHITNLDVFVDKAFHGGGIHQGKKKSFLDMHLDFNYHPINKNWYRSLNLLLYLNKNWKPEYGGHLCLQDLRTGEKKDVEVPFNRLVIQLTNNYTLHGYNITNFPEGVFRTSIAAYAYMPHQHHIEKPRTTDWHVKSDQPVKQFLAWIYNPAVKIKNKLFGSSTAKN
ncbi:MAG: 2OG-Fe(II) oxygenase [Bacteroidia bacterium]|nr:2OG-Fe(II) oxygenase [Bacteroidia bacterium]